MLSYDTDGHINTSLYDKRDDFNFSITNFPFLSSNTPSSPAYGVFISQLIRYARASTNVAKNNANSSVLLNKRGDLQQQVVAPTAKHPMQKHKAERDAQGTRNVNEKHRNIKQKGLHINQRDQWATGADLSPRSTAIPLYLRSFPTSKIARSGENGS
ncbi:hypothetical protein FSP39_025240 [Pinctada imbricata]|uniref:Uncharacterized protein n=1 Tax=Pinctada imbricata TaxID=66713 RepID=A0AA88YSZ7_PINIB|nr:hypothetical protein FSP39_025240 [Pinctada imbricata]